MSKYKVKHGYEIQIRHCQCSQKFNDFLKTLDPDDVLEIQYASGKYCSGWTLIYQRPRG